jgi:hypothetical protein
MKRPLLSLDSITSIMQNGLDIHRKNILSVLEYSKQYHDYLIFNRMNIIQQLPGIIDRIGTAVDACIKAYSTHRINTNKIVETCKVFLNRIHILLVDREFQTLYVVPYSSDIKIIEKFKQFENKIRSHHDRLFQALDIKRPGSKFAALPTEICTSFLKGITYFDTDLPLKERPFYHRPDSCDKKTLSAEAKFEALPTNTNKTRTKKKTAVKLCYIERTIYDAIYTHVHKRQDVAHLVELRRTERIYQDYHRSESLTVNLEYDSAYDAIPVKLIIITIQPNRKIIDEYEKPVESDTVQCLRTIFAGVVTTTYHKTQTTKKEQPWILDPSF